MDNYSNENNYQQAIELLNNTRFDNTLDWSKIAIIIGDNQLKYKTQEIINLLEKYQFMDMILTIGTFKKPYIYIIEANNKNQIETITNNEYLENGNMKFKTYKPNSNTIKATLHWLPPNINNESINKALSNYGQTQKIIDLKLNNLKYPNLKTTKKI